MGASVRGVSAKRLRREAAGQTVGAPAVAYGLATRKREPMCGAGYYGSISPGVMIIGRMLDPRCTRSVYQQLKKRAT